MNSKWYPSLLLLALITGVLTSTPAHATDSVVTLETSLPFVLSDDFDWSTYTLTSNRNWSGSIVKLGDDYFGMYDLTLSGAVVTSSQAIFGSQSDYNNVTLTGSSTSWTNTSYLYVGRKGAYNQLTIADGATFATQYAYVGKMWFKNLSGTAISADSNTVSVTGIGSALTVSAALYVGGEGDNNSLSVTDGGAVTANASTIGDATEGDGNSVTVSGTGSSWKTKNELVVGNSGEDSSLTVADGGTVTSGSLSVAKSAGSKNNIVTVTGGGSTLSVSGTFALGVSGSNNSLTVSNGGKVFSGTSTIGSNSMGYTTNNNTALVTGAGSVWTATDLTIYSGNTLTVQDGGLMKITDTLTLRSGAYIEIDGGYLAWAGDHGLAFQSLIEEGYFQGLNSSTGEWEVVMDSTLFNIAYALTASESSDATGGLYSDLAGYTIVSLSNQVETISSFTALRFSASAVPEPSAGMMLLAVALTGMGWRALRNERVSRLKESI